MIGSIRPNSGRRAIGLGRRPGLQLKLPLLLLGITALFGALFAAHSWAAWGDLVRFSATEPWVAMQADAIVRDYMTVSSAIAGGYVLFLMLVCLAYTHRLLGPIVALERHLENLRLGRFEARVRLRDGDPLSLVAEELNALTARLSAESSAADRQHEPDERHKDPRSTKALLAAMATPEA